ncbi:WD domain, G-beta repeat [Popillia japonica]|uniref:WD domain, G-beta repeat n=1 Tax=Popillia japonica TaxID=7064 RepID=A0AAW1JBG0_POPJA
MKFSYKFSNLLGTVYREGDLLFTPDGNSVISPVGNRISIFDLRSNKATTLPIESKYSYNALDISPNGCTLIAINEQGDAHMISLISQTIVHKYRFKRKAPGPFTGEYNAFIMEKVFHAAYDETTCVDWSSDSKVIAVGSKDMTVKLYPLDKWSNFKIYSLGSHTDSIVSCFFEKNSLDLISISKNGQMCVWESSMETNDFKQIEAPPSKKQKSAEDLDEDDIDVSKVPERTEEELAAALKDVRVEDNAVEEDKLYYKRIARHYLGDAPRKDDRKAILTAASYHKTTKVLVTGFSSGAFFIHEMPDCNLIHSLSISEQEITSICLNSTADWIALGCSGFGQLLVWEWQSETYVLKQQGHSNNMTCVAYSIDGQLLATGGDDGKVKLWNIHSGFCFVTFQEHTNAVTGIAFSGTKKFAVSASLDGTVRCFDVLRYRNFKTLTTPRPVQLTCVAVDTSGEFVAAGGQDVFEIFLWSVKLGRLLEILSGHEGPVAGLAFSPTPASTTLASVSWDKTLKIWDAIEKGSAHETIELLSDGLCVAFNPNGQEVAVGTLDSQITVFNVRTAQQMANIEGRNDLGSGRSDTDLITAKQTLKAKSFTTLCYTADGNCILAGGQSKNVCIYNVKEGIILKKFEITQNRSLDAVDDFINRRKMTEYGNVALVEEREILEGGHVTIKLPGVRKGDMASRSFKPEVRVFSLQFSPTGQAWAAATTEGLLVYSLTPGLMFDPWNLQMGITPTSVREAISNRDHTNALMMAMKLNDANLIQEVMENVPFKDVELTISTLGEQYVERLLTILANSLDTSRHLEYYLHWTQHVLTYHGPRIKAQQNMPALISLQKSLTRKYDQLSKICDFNKYTLQYLVRQGALMAKDDKTEAMTYDEEDVSEGEQPVYEMQYESD